MVFLQIRSVLGWDVTRPQSTAFWLLQRRYQTALFLRGKRFWQAQKAYRGCSEDSEEADDKISNNDC